jgi:ribulose-5-phosphate 4-epimerase/fuculose-1-phosphate aldolase
MHNVELRERSIANVGCSPEEWAARVDLACAYRLFHHLGWHALIFNHITLRVPGPDRHFLINPFGLMYREVTASNLLKVDLDGNLVEPSQWPLFEAGFVVHSGIHRHNDHIHCVMHTHSDTGVAVSCLADGLLPLDSTALRFAGRIAYHDFTMLPTERSESENLFLLEMACRAQITAQSAGARLLLQSKETLEIVTHQKETHPAEDNSEALWAAMLRWMRDIDPSFEA